MDLFALGNGVDSIEASFPAPGDGFGEGVINHIPDITWSILVRIQMIRVVEGLDSVCVHGRAQINDVVAICAKGTH